MKYRPPCPFCRGTGALEAERCPVCTKPRSGILPRDLRMMYLRLYARFGRWEPGLFCFIDSVDDKLASEGLVGRRFYLEKVQPVEERATWSEWGLVPFGSDRPSGPTLGLSGPTFPPFVSGATPVLQMNECVARQWEPDMSRTCHACGCKMESATCGKCGAKK